MALVTTDSGGLRQSLAALGAERLGKGERHIVLTANSLADLELVVAQAQGDSSVSGTVLYDMGPMLTLYFDDFDGSTYEVNWYKPGR